jgi:hypothetical protein
MKINRPIIALFALVISNSSVAQVAPKHLILTPGYFMNDNKVVYITVNSKTKVEKKFQPISGITVNLYLDSTSPATLISKVTTDEKGMAKAIIPPSFKAGWEASEKHKFLAVADAQKSYDEATGEIEITKSKIIIDTLNEDGKRSVVVKVLAFDGKDWKPVKDVEMKVGVSRLGSILLVGEEASYTTDSTGQVTAEFKRDKLPGDQKGDLILVAKVEDNETYGNLAVTRAVPWGLPTVYDNPFIHQRTLWSARFHTPYWLMIVAYSVIVAVWGIIIFLLFQAVKVKKLGKLNTSI